MKKNQMKPSNDRRKNSTLQKRTAQILKKLAPLYENEPIGISWETPFQLVVGVILSAQCTDKRVNLVTQKFFDRFRSAQDFLKLTQTELEEMIRPTGFFRNKAKNILGAAKIIAEKYSGHIPDRMEDLVPIPGFGRKTANVILNQLHNKNEGVVVDTHVWRLSKLLGLTSFDDPIRIERDLMKLTAAKNWHRFAHYFILHGRSVCVARKPKCGECVLAKLCPSSSL